MIVKRIKTAVDSKLRKEQAGFRKEKSCSDQFFNIKKHNRAMHRMAKATYINFIDYEKAFDSIHRDSLWKILRHYGIPSKIDDLVKAFYTELKCTIGSSSNTSFLVKSGV